LGFVVVSALQQGVAITVKWRFEAALSHIPSTPTTLSLPREGFMVNEKLTQMFSWVGAKASNYCASTSCPLEPTSVHDYRKTPRKIMNTNIGLLRNAHSAIF